MAGCIENNPFRVLGVYSNASAKDIAGNKSRMQAYLKVNREVSFPLDNAISLPIQRNQTIVEAALSEINLSQDKIRHALFWFIKGSPIDEMAIQHLAAGNTDKFFDLLIRKGDYCSQINKAVYAMAVEDFEAAVIDMTAIIHDDDNREAFVSSVCGEAFSISEDDLAHLYIDTLLDCYPDVDWRQIFIDFGKSGEDDDYISDKIVGKPVSEINAEISKAKSVARDDAQANLKAGKQLILSTKANLAYLKEILGSTNSQYQMIADKLALQILQNGINYFNNVDDSDGIDDAMKIQSYAQKIAVGKVAKDRCNENVKILNDIKAKLPPASCRYHNDIIKNKILSAIQNKTCNSAIKLIQDSFIYLQSIKAELGASNDFYLSVSTEVAMVALGLVIDDFNGTFNDRLKMMLILDREGTISRVKSKCREALTATLYMDQLDMEPDFRNNRYATNKSTLKNQANQIDVYVSSSVVQLDRRSEDDIFAKISSLRAIDEYKRLFPHGKYISQCNAKAERIAFDSCKTTQDCESFKRNYPNSSLDINSKWEDCFIKQCKTIQDFKNYLSSYPNGRHRVSAQNSIVKLEYNSCKTIQDYEAFISKYPTSSFVAEARTTIADERAWAQACASDEKAAYKEYLAKYPNGRHKDVAQNKASACYIATMVYGDYNCAEVLALRSFRDTVLRNSHWGQRFIAFYYRHSPAFVEKFKDHKLINSMVRSLLNIFVKLYTK